MRLGVCTTDLPRMTPDALFDKAASLGFDCVQFAFDSVPIDGFTADTRIEIPGDVPRGTLDEIMRASIRTGLPVVAANGTFNMAHPDAAVRDEGIRRFPGFLDAARSLGCTLVSVCTGSRNPAHLWQPHPDNNTPGAWDDMRGTMLRCAEYAAARGMTLLVEVEASNVVDTPEKARRLLQECGAAVKIVLDPANLFHAGMAHRKNVRPTLDRAFELLGADIALAHGKDIREGDGIDFCPTGEGIVDFPYLLALLEKYGCGVDLMLHGIFTDAAFHRSVSYIRGLFR